MVPASDSNPHSIAVEYSLLIEIRSIVIATNLLLKFTSKFSSRKFPLFYSPLNMALFTTVSKFVSF